jgi:glycogen debranching enzyme
MSETNPTADSTPPPPFVPPHNPKTPTISSALAIKQGNLFLLTEEDGNVSPGEHIYGLYFHDCRFLKQASLSIDDVRPVVLYADATDDNELRSLYSNPDLQREDRPMVYKQSLAITREMIVTDCLSQRLEIRNVTPEPVRTTITLGFASKFDDIFVIRGVEAEQYGTLHEPHYEEGRLTLRYDGADNHVRITTVHFDPMPDAFDGTTASYSLQLEPQSAVTIQTTVRVEDRQPPGEQRKPAEQEPIRAHAPWHERIKHGKQQIGSTVIKAGDPQLGRLLDRAFLDLEMLTTQQRDDLYFAAGIPWFVALFGRDSCITALQMLPYEPRIAAHTLHVLAEYQGQQERPERDEEPGKILHELRIGELANLHEVPFTPYYGTVDATPLWLLLLGEYLRWTSDFALLDHLQPNVDAALHWIAHYGDSDGDGFVEYRRKAGKGLSNQGWKDSGNSIVRRDGTLAKPPIALVEVQGYVYRAKLLLATAYRHRGDEQRATALEREAAELQRRFDEAFWMSDRNMYALALEQAEKRQVDVITSNPGHALWCGIVPEERAESVRHALMSPEMWSGWGIRTLSAAEHAFNPIDYQVGAIWPHDNALIGIGLKRYGFSDDAAKMFTALCEAAVRFTLIRLPEVFAGYDRNAYRAPVQYPLSCSPQAWAAGALPSLLWALLGLEPDAFTCSLHIVRPHLPAWLPWLEIHGLHLGEATVDLRWERMELYTGVTMLRHSGDLRVVVE